MDNVRFFKRHFFFFSKVSIFRMFPRTQLQLLPWKKKNKKHYNLQGFLHFIYLSILSSNLPFLFSQCLFIQEQEDNFYRNLLRILFLFFMSYLISFTESISTKMEKKKKSLAGMIFRIFNGLFYRIFFFKYLFFRFITGSIDNKMALLFEISIITENAFKFPCENQAINRNVLHIIKYCFHLHLCWKFAFQLLINDDFLNLSVWIIARVISQ